jgi:hypothetical protein
MPKGLPITKPMMIPLLLRLGIRAQCGVDSCCNHSTHSYSDRQNGLAACDSEGPAEKAGKKIDQVTENVSDSVSNAAH